ncbi:MAG: cytochrome c peroxidase [Longimicrobiales bacterium]
MIETQAAFAGRPFIFEATLAGRAFSAGPEGKLTYRVTLDPGVTGITTSGSIIRGTATEAVTTRVTIVASNANGDTATQQFRIVFFDSSLTTPSLPQQASAYADARVLPPRHFVIAAAGSVLAADNTPPDNPISDAGAALGRVLFYDKRLSSNDRVACSSCHQQAAGFSDTLRFSVGIHGGHTAVHSMALANARYYRRGRFFWDERAASLEDQVLRPIQDTLEMGTTLENLEAKLRVTPFYAPLFDAAFGSTAITSDRIARALSQFVRSMLSADARFDRTFDAFGQPDLRSFTAAEAEGLQLFNVSGCASCHRTNAQVSDGPSNTGLDVNASSGVAGTGAFKAPSLRNVAVRRFFMHDGRFSSLEAVVAFYDSVIQMNPNLERRLRSPDGSVALRLNLSASQRTALVAYLGTLTDSSFLAAEKYSSPFRSIQ